MKPASLLALLVAAMPAAANDVCGNGSASRMACP